MKHRYNPFMIIIFGLLAIGILVQFTRSPGGILIPLLVFGIIFYFYKFPPKSMGKGFPLFRSMRVRPKPGNRAKDKGMGRKNPFRVIPGSKTRNSNDDDDDNSPRYH